MKRTYFRGTLYLIEEDASFWMECISCGWRSEQNYLKAEAALKEGITHTCTGVSNDM